jgi:hypothetical protein
MVYMAICHFLATHPKALVVPLVVYALSIQRMSQLVDTSEIPDLRFGFSPNELHMLMHDQWGPEGCQAYAAAAMMDLFPYMESYSVILGALLVMGAARQKWDERVAWIGALTLLMDVGETLICRTASIRVVDEAPPLTDGWIHAASIFNQLKWVMFGVAVATIVVSHLLPDKNKAKAS